MEHVGTRAGACGTRVALKAPVRCVWACKPVLAWASGAARATAFGLALGAAALLVCGCRAPGPGSSRSSSVTPSVTAASSVHVTVESWAFGAEEGRLIRTPAYRVFTTDNTPLVADRMALFMESALLTYRTMLGPLGGPSVPLDVYLMATRGQWEALTRQTAGPRADIYLRIQRGGYAENARAVFYNIGPRDTFAIAGHEGWHQFTQATFREALPIWLEEGIAVGMEGFRWSDDGERATFLAWSNLERYDRLRELVAAGRRVPLESLLTQRPQDLLQDSGLATLDYYAQAWALVHFLREGEGGRYEAGLERIVRDAAQGRLSSRLAQATSAREARAAMLGRVGEAPFRAYFGDVSQASAAFDAFVDEAIRPGGRERVLRGESPVTR